MRYGHCKRIDRKHWRNNGKCNKNHKLFIWKIYTHPCDDLKEMQNWPGPIYGVLTDAASTLWTTHLMEMQIFCPNSWGQDVCPLLKMDCLVEGHCSIQWLASSCSLPTDINANTSICMILGAEEMVRYMGEDWPMLVKCDWKIWVLFTCFSYLAWSGSYASFWVHSYLLVCQALGLKMHKGQNEICDKGGNTLEHWVWPIKGEKKRCQNLLLHIEE